MIAWTEYTPGNHRINCPVCTRKPSDKTLGITLGHDGHGVAHCFRCNYVESHRPKHGTAYRPAAAIVSPVQPSKHETLSGYWLDLWNVCKPLYGVSAQYLKSRHCASPPEDGDLRCHPALKHPSGYVGAALVALITDVHTNQPISLHRTWVNADGSKADVNPPRMLLAGHRKQGGVIRLWPDECVGCRVAICEGIETGLSLGLAYEPVWACIDAGNLGQFPVLPGVASLLIAADNDVAGIAAANQCAMRWANAEREVFITQQSQNDINDAVLEAA